MRMSGLGQSESGGACHDLIDEKAVLLGAGWDVMENLHGTYGNDRQIIYKSSTNHLEIIYKWVIPHITIFHNLE